MGFLQIKPCIDISLGKILIKKSSIAEWVVNCSLLAPVSGVYCVVRNRFAVINFFNWHQLINWLKGVLERRHGVEIIDSLNSSNVLKHQLVRCEYFCIPIQGERLLSSLFWSCWLGYLIPKKRSLADKHDKFGVII